MSQNRYLFRRFAVLAVFGLVIYGAVRVVGTVTGDSTASGEGPAGSPTTIAAAPAASTTVVAAPTTVIDEGTGPPTAERPAQILIVGDSDAGAVGPYLQQLINTDDDVSAVADVTLDYVVSTGLARPDYFDWPAHLADGIAEHDPDLVIVNLGGNDAQGLSEPCANGPKTCQPDWVVGEPVPNAQEWSAEYARRVGAMLDLLEGRRVIWVGIPNAADERMTAGLELQDQAVRTALDGRDDVLFVDTWDRFDGGNGGYAEYVPDPRDGRAKPIRASDGFHLNTTGAEILAIDIFDQVEAVLRDLGAEL